MDKKIAEAVLGLSVKLSVTRNDPSYMCNALGIKRPVTAPRNRCANPRCRKLISNNKLRCLSCQVELLEQASEPKELQ